MPGSSRQGRRSRAPYPWFRVLLAWTVVVAATATAASERSLQNSNAAVTRVTTSSTVHGDSPALAVRLEESHRPEKIERA
jgi:hypothetical protein